MTKYLLRLKYIGKKRLVYKAYQEQLNETENRNHWVWKMNEILDKDVYSYMFLGLSNKIKFKGKEIFEQKIFHHILNKNEKGEGKLLFYAKLKQQFKQEKYLNLTNIKHRNAIWDIRMSTQKLQIETGRYNKVPKHGGTIRYRKNIGCVNSAK